MAPVSRRAVVGGYLRSFLILWTQVTTPRFSDTSPDIHPGHVRTCILDTIRHVDRTHDWTSPDMTVDISGHDWTSPDMTVDISGLRAHAPPTCACAGLGDEPPPPQASTAEPSGRRLRKARRSARPGSAARPSKGRMTDVVAIKRSCKEQITLFRRTTTPVRTRLPFALGVRKLGL